MNVCAQLPSSSGPAGRQEIRRLTTTAPDPLGGSWRDFLARPGADLTAKAAALTAWADARVQFGGFPFAQRLMSAPGPAAGLRALDGAVRRGLNFSTQDYLGLATHPEVTQAASAALARYGVHSAGSAAVAGAHDSGDELERALGDFLGMDCVTLFPSGWAAGYGAVRALVRATDHVVLDTLASNCLHEGALAATPQRHRFRHLDLEHLHARLAAIRARDRLGGILVATESLFAVDAAVPDLMAMQTLCREFGALLLVDVSHDLGCLGPDGTGQLGRQGLHGKADIVIGSFAKTFASNGGFVATRRREVREYLRYFSPTHAFSCALSPLQLGAVLAALRLVRSVEGDRRRSGLLTAAHALRGGLVARGATVLGTPAPLVPVFVGRDAAGRVAVKLAAEAGVLANLVEAPLVPRHASRLRLLVSALHEPAACEAVAARIVEAISRSHELPCRCDAAA